MTDPSNSHSHRSLVLAGFVLVFLAMAMGPPTAWAASHVADTSWSVQTADAYLRSVASDDTKQVDPRALDAYLHILSAVGASNTESASSTESAADDGDAAAADDTRAILQARFAQLAPLLPQAVLSRVVENEASRDASEWTFRPDAGTHLVEWWRKQDVMPATEKNERLLEHLQRLQFAKRHFSCAATTSGLDARGQVYLRLGPPLEREDISFRNGEFMDGVFRFGVSVGLSDFPDSAFWRYTGRDMPGYFLFVESGDGCYKIGTADDLIPASLRRAQGSTKRGMNRAYSAMVAMRYVYRELALMHPDFQARHAEVASYAQWQEGKQKEVEAARAFSDQEFRPGVLDSEKGTQQEQIGGGRYVFWNPLQGIDPPDRFMQRTLISSRQEDEAIAKQRETVLPRTQTTMGNSYRPLTVAFRPTRFLTPQGSTRVELSWGMHSGALQSPASTPPDTPVLLVVDGVRYDTDYRSKERDRVQYFVRASEQQGVFLSEPLQFATSATSPQHIGVQWSGYTTDPFQADSVRIDQHTWLTTARIDSLAPLSADPSQLLLSDLRPMIPRSSDAASVSVSDYAAYPFDTFTVGTPLALYFEVYHLTFGTDDTVAYTVEYQVDGEAERSRLGRLFRGADERSTTVTSTYEGTSRTAKEYILLDLDDWDADSEADITVTVRVTDETSGQSVERAIDLRLVPEE